MTEGDLQRDIMLAVSKTGARVFRNNTAQGWVGQLVSKVTRQFGFGVILENARPLHAGLCTGSSDLIGWTSTGRFLGIEVKTSKGRVSAEQQNFIDAVNQAGGLAFVARSVDEAVAKLNG